MAINNIENTDVDTLERLSLRSLREITLHNSNTKIISESDLSFAINKLKEIDDELQSRRVT